MADVTDAAAVGTGLINPLIPIGFEVGKTLLSLFGGQQDPEEIYRQRTNEATRYINQYFGSQTALARRSADRDASLAGQAGSRQAAAVGYAGNASSFSAPAQSNIFDRLKDRLSNLDSARLGEIARVKSSALNLPIYQKPNTYDYLSALTGAVGKGVMANEAGTNALTQQKKYADDLFASLNQLLSGQDSSSGSLNRFRGGLNFTQSPTDFSSIPSQPKDRASRYFNFGME